MRTDTYTKVMLTIIAVCLLWIAAGGPALVPAVEAQGEQRVVIVGWQPSIYDTGVARGMPLPITTEANRR